MAVGEGHACVGVPCDQQVEVDRAQTARREVARPQRHGRASVQAAILVVPPAARSRGSYSGVMMSGASSGRMRGGERLAGPP